MMRAAAGPLLAFALVSMAMPAGSHHSIAKFDGQRILQLTGTVATFRWINPHVSFEIDVEDAVAASSGRWTVEMRAPGAMADEGWAADTIKAGDRLTVFAHPLRHPDAAPERRVLYAGALLADGTALGYHDTKQRGDD